MISISSKPFELSLEVCAKEELSKDATLEIYFLPRGYKGGFQMAFKFNKTNLKGDVVRRETAKFGKRFFSGLTVGGRFRQTPEGEMFKMKSKISKTQINESSQATLRITISGQTFAFSEPVFALKAPNPTPKKAEHLDDIRAKEPIQEREPAAAAPAEPASGRNSPAPLGGEDFEMVSDPEEFEMV